LIIQIYFDISGLHLLRAKANIIINEEKQDNLYRIARILYYALLFYPFVPSLHYGFGYHNPQYWGSKVIPTGIYNNFISRIPFMVIEWYLTAAGGFAAGFLALTVMVHAKLLTFWTVGLR